MRDIHVGCYAGQSGFATLRMGFTLTRHLWTTEVPSASVSGVELEL